MIFLPRVPAAVLFLLLIAFSGVLRTVRSRRRRADRIRNIHAILAD